MIKTIQFPKTESGNDPADHVDNIAYEQEVVNSINEAKPKATPPSIAADFDLSTFILNGQSKIMEESMLDDKYILGRMALLGQSTIFYAKPNAGKTLLTIWLLIESIKSNQLIGNDVFYVNADDNHKGLTYKLKLAESHGFNMLAPGYNSFDSSKFSLYISAWVAGDKARGKVIILDTVKKFVDLMRKDKASSFGESIRQFVLHGGSVIMLAHVNKHKGDDGKVVFSGTSDLVDDADCAYTLDILSDDDGVRTVKFENFKARGDVSLESVFTYDASEGKDYPTRLESVRELNGNERQDAVTKQALDQMLEVNREAVEAIKESIRSGLTLKTELIKGACASSGISKRRVIRALNDHTGSDVNKHQFWHVILGDKNAHSFSLNWGA